ncbi:response regulator [Paucibacter sp. B51]|uniref:response regulator n=1 Tax=Paucibacter sp. B51 TaxID=2993315 RepID=UPI0022EBDF5A|nr:response regulator transcription factor [Paucibacter sp. B51]
MNIALVDDHTLLREGLVALLSQAHPQMQCLQYASLGALLTGLESQGAPDLVLLDLGLPDAQGLDALQRLREALEWVPVIVVSADERPATVLACLEGGAAGFIPKTAHFELLWSQLSAALEGRIALPASFRLQSEELGETPHFSDRQQEVLGLLLRGLSNKSIARRLEMSESTVKTHLAVIFRKLNVSRRAEAMVVAARLGFRLPAWSAEPALLSSATARLATPAG